MSRENRQSVEKMLKEKGWMNLNSILNSLLWDIPDRYQDKQEYENYKQEIVMLIEFLWKHSKTEQDRDVLFKGFDPCEFGCVAGEAFNKETGEFEETE